jgi:DNA-binding GntR family transcriptional regulator
VRQVYDVRELLQRQAALNIPLPAPPSVVSKLQEINEKYRECIAIGNLRGIHENNDLFHEVFYAACGNSYLTDLVCDYMDITLTIRAKNLADSGLLQVSIAHHDLMIKYLQGSDNWVLAELCVEHIRPSKEQYLEMLGD